MSEIVHKPVGIEDSFVGERLAFLYSGLYTHDGEHDRSGHIVLAENYKINQTILSQRERDIAYIHTLRIVTTEVAEELLASYDFMQNFAEPLYPEDENTRARWSVPSKETGISTAQEQYDANISEARAFVAENLPEIILMAAREARADGIPIRTRHLYAVG